LTSTDSSLEVTLLGEPAARHNGQPVHLGSGLRRAVFSTLALRANHVLSRTRLIQAVWGQEAPASASGSLYTYISDLRRALEPNRAHGDLTNTLTTSSAGYQLTVQPDRVDVHRLDQLREQARVLGEAGDARQELVVLDEALALWTGEALAGVPGPFAEANRSRLREVRLAMIERRTELVIATDRYDEVIDELADLVQDHPAREGLHGLLMTSLFRAGRQTDALQAYLRARTVLMKRFHTEPGLALRALHQRILAGDSTIGRQAGPTGTGRGRRVPSSVQASKPFVGRGAALAELRAAVTDVVAGRGGCVWIEGPPGSGKSALLAAGLADAAPGCTMSWAHADEFAQPIPYYAIERCLGDIGATLPHTTAGQVSRQPDMPVESELEHVRRVVGSHVGQPLVMVLDDLQWADRESLSVWHYLRGLSQHRPLLMVSACRPLPQHQDLGLMRELTGEPRSRTIVLPPLTDAESRELIHRATPLAAPSTRMIVGLAGGNPTYLLAMANAVEEYGQVRTWKAVPPQVAAVVLDHFGHLSEPARETLRAMALVGDVCSIQDIVSATGTKASGLVDILAEALAVDTLREFDPDVRFAHPLLRRVLYESVPESLRLAVYQQFAT
jgi:DNA-binding SARP family transcriptional activator